MSTDTAMPFSQALVEGGAVPEPCAAEVKPLASNALDRGRNAVPDEELLQTIGRGDKQALGVLFQRHGRSVLNVARRILRDEGEADDLRQDVFLYIYQRAKSYDSEKASAASWIIQIAYHRAIDRWRHLTVRQHYHSEELDEQGIGALFTQPSTDHLDGKAILERLRSQLSPEQQRTLELHFFEGYSLREIAQESGQNVGAVRHHYYRALNKLRANLFSKKRG